MLVDSRHDSREEALTELRERLEDKLAHERLTKTVLAVRASLSRTVVSEAFQVGGPVPSARTVAGLARALRLRAEEVQELLELRRAAAGENGRSAPGIAGLGKPISEWDPHDLEIHPAALAPGEPSNGWLQRALPGYVRRTHDQVLAEAVSEAVSEAAEGHSRMLVLVGSSSVGKTRACWEAVQPLAARGWRLWHPYDPTRAEAALLDLNRVQPHTVVWLNEAQHYLGHGQDDERIAAALHTLLTDRDRRPLLVLGTLWPEHADAFTALPRPNEDDLHSRARELLSGRTLTVPDAFDQDALGAATMLAQDGDKLLSDALTRAHAHGQVTQDLAGAPELLRRYEHGTAPVRALLEAAMDARRLGVGLHLPQEFLIDAATDYLSDYDYDQLTEDWAEASFADLARPVHGRQAPLRRTRFRRLQHRPPGLAAQDPVPVTGPVFRLADYLEQHGRTIRRRCCPPASFWQAAHIHLTQPDDVVNLYRAAKDRHRRLWTDHLVRRGAEIYRSVTVPTTVRARKETEGQEAAEALDRQAVDARHVDVFTHLARLREGIGDREGAAALCREAEELRSRPGREVRGILGAAHMRRPDDFGNPSVLMMLAQERVEARDWESTEAFVWQLAHTRRTEALTALVLAREKAGNDEAAEALAWQAADAGHPEVLTELVWERKKTLGWESTEVLAIRAADAGYLHSIPYQEEWWPYGLDPDGSPTPPWSRPRR
ncbi:hypothetical protein [Streptomyces sp. NPDC012508]|uniref:hypothetical protein n=1 Tax=Streptomyces sp. NPDC012508 TaxID=3364837 RepID=UPI0036B1C61F